MLEVRDAPEELWGFAEGEPQLVTPSTQKSVLAEGVSKGGLEDTEGRQCPHVLPGPGSEGSRGKSRDRPSAPRARPSRVLAATLGQPGNFGSPPSFSLTRMQCWNGRAGAWSLTPWLQRYAPSMYRKPSRTSVPRKAASGLGDRA